MDLLQLFYTDEHTREAVRKFQIAMLEEETIERVFKGKDISGLKDAKDVIESSFRRLNDVYGSKDEPTNQTNR